MRSLAVHYILQSCRQKQISNAHDLSTLSGVDEDKLILLFDSESEEDSIATTRLLLLNGKEWHRLISSSGFSVQDWVMESFQVTSNLLKKTPLSPEVGEHKLIFNEEPHINGILWLNFFCIRATRISIEWRGSVCKDFEEA